MDWIRITILWFKNLLRRKVTKRILYTSGSILFMILGAFLFYLYGKFISSPEIFPWIDLGKLVMGFLAFFGAILYLIHRTIAIELEAKKYELTKNQELASNYNNIEQTNISIDSSSNTLGWIRGNSDRTVYDKRSEHYKEEKEILAREYVKFLQNRVQFVTTNRNKYKNYSKVFIIFDSGTTISPIIDRLGYQSFSEGGNHWAKKGNVDFYSNNLSGIQALFKYTEGEDRYSSLPFSCNVLPGKILKAFNATASEDTVESILKLKQFSNVYKIVVITGNYILFDQSRKIFRPIARAGHHPDVKAAMYDIGDEVHVVAPLGKILQNVFNRKLGLRKMVDVFNKDLGYTEKSSQESKKPYHLVDKVLLESNSTVIPLTTPRNDNWSQKSILITTSRERDHYYLNQHSTSLQVSLEEFSPEYDLGGTVSDSAFIKFFPFDGLPNSITLQKEIEIPHSNLRVPEKISKYFYFGKSGSLSKYESKENASNT